MIILKSVYYIFLVVIRFSGLAWVFRFFIAKSKITIVHYHNPTPDVFEDHVKYFSTKYNIISLNEVIEAFSLNNFNNIPNYALVITMDDGWKENYELLPIIRNYNFKPTIFLTSNLINTQRHFWWTECETKQIQRFKKLRNSERLAFLNKNYNYEINKEYGTNRQALNYDEIEEMKGLVDFGLHTCNHPILTKCSFKEKVSEIIDCKRSIEAILGKEIKSFSYPNGDYDDECITILKESGIKIARTTDVGWNHAATNPYKLKVTGVSDNGSINKLIAELTGIPMFIQFLLTGKFNGKKH